MIHLDTSFVVDLLRERRRNAAGPAIRLLRELEGEELAISSCVVCELRAGAELARSPDAEHELIDLLEATLSVVAVDSETARHYGRLLAHLRQRGIAIATMDLLIAATSLAAEAPLVTRNRKHFERIPGLALREY